MSFLSSLVSPLDPKLYLSPLKLLVCPQFCALLDFPFLMSVLMVLIVWEFVGPFHKVVNCVTYFSIETCIFLWISLYALLDFIINDYLKRVIKIIETSDLSGYCFLVKGATTHHKNQPQTVTNWFTQKFSLQNN